MQRFDFPKFCEYAKKYKVTTMFTVPPIYLLIAKSPLVKDHFASWDDAVSGAAPMGQDLQVEVGRKLGGGTTLVRQTWGLSETVRNPLLVFSEDAFDPLIRLVVVWDTRQARSQRLNEEATNHILL